jgi:hypothetical protein
VWRLYGDAKDVIITLTWKQIITMPASAFAFSTWRVSLYEGGGAITPHPILVYMELPFRFRKYDIAE